MNKKFKQEFNDLLMKHSIEGVVLTNFDNDEMGFMQLLKITEMDSKKYLWLAYSAKHEFLCPSCMQDQKCDVCGNSEEGQKT